MAADFYSSGAAPIAAAIYSSKARTLPAAGAIAVILLVLHALRGPHSAMEWGTPAAQAAFIVLLSLLINELSVHARANERSATGPAGGPALEYYKFVV